MKKLVLLGLAGFTFFCAGSQREMLSQPQSQRVNVTLRGQTLDDLDVALHPWRLKLERTTMELSLVDATGPGPTGLIKEWQVNNDAPDKTDKERCPAFHSDWVQLGNRVSTISIQPFGDTLPTPDGRVCRYTIILRPRNESDSTISVDPEYRLGP